MGSFCSRLDSIEHATTLDDITNIIQMDKNLFLTQLHVLEGDKSLNTNLKERKIKYFLLIVNKLDEYLVFLRKLQSLKNLEVYELKVKYKYLMKEVDTLQYQNINSQLLSFENFIYNEIIPIYRVEVKKN